MKPGFLLRQFEKANDEIKEWPLWMRQEVESQTVHNLRLRKQELELELIKINAELHNLCKT